MYVEREQKNLEKNTTRGHMEDIWGDQPFVLAKTRLSPGQLSPGTPQVVRWRIAEYERPSSRNNLRPQLLAMWTTISGELALVEHAQACDFTVRRLAELSGVAVNNVRRYAEILVEMGLIEIVGYHTSEGRGGHQNTTPIYDIDYVRLIRESEQLAQQQLRQRYPRRSATSGTPIPPEQLSLFGDTASGDPLCDPSLWGCHTDVTVPEGCHTDVTVPEGCHTDVTESGDSCHTDVTVPEGCHTDVTESGDSCHIGVIQRERETERERESSPPNQQDGNTLTAAPEPPAGEMPIVGHPLNLWQNIAGSLSAAAEQQILQWCLEHDTFTDGFGAYWVGRAMLETSWASKCPELRYVRFVLERWADEHQKGAEGGYGSKAPRQKEGGHGTRSARQQPARTVRRDPADSTDLDALEAEINRKIGHNQRRWDRAAHPTGG